MKNKIIQNLIRNMKNGNDRRRTYESMRSRKARMMAVALCAALALGQAGVVVYAQTSGDKIIVQTADDKTETTGAGNMTDIREIVNQGTDAGMGAVRKAGAPVNMLLAANTTSNKTAKTTGKASNAAESTAKEKSAGAEEAKAEKDETVYILAGADGSVQKIIVSDWLKNAAGDSTINDISELTDIENVRDDLHYTDETGDVKVWDAQGNDIYYQGNIDKELPVTLSVSYTLDGKNITPEELAGKSGKVKIRFDYTNNLYETVELDGVPTKMYIPFAMMTGMILDDEIFTNVEVTNGRLLNDGSRTVVAGLAFPGLQENLDIDAEKLEVPDYVEITADVKDFEMGMTATIASNDVFSEIDLEDKDDLEDLRGSMDEMTDAMEQLMDGSNQLYDGICTLLEKSGELIEGIDKLASGAEELKNGVGTLDSGVSQVADGAAKLQEGLNTLSSKNAELNGGARQVFDTLLSTARTQLVAAGLDVPEMTVENYAEVLNNTIASLDEDAVYQQALTQVTNAVEEKRSYIESQVTDVVKGEVASKVDAAVREQVTAKVEEAAREQVTAAVTEAVRQQVTAKVTEAAEPQVTEQVTAAVRAAVMEKVEAAGKEEITKQVTAAVRAEVERQVNEAVKAEVTRQVNAAVKEQVAKQVEEAAGAKIREEVTAAVYSQVTEQVIKSATGMDAAAYEAAVGAGKVDAQTQSAVQAAIEGQKASEAVKARIEDEVQKQLNAAVEAQMSDGAVQKQVDAQIEAQMSGEAVKGQINTATEAQMSSDEVKAQIDANVKSVVDAKVEEQMATDAVKAQITSNVEEQMQKIVPAKVEEQMATDEIKATVQSNTDEQMETIVPAKVEEQMATDEIKATIQSNIDAQMGSDALKETVAANTELQVQKAITENMAGEEVQSKLAAASEGAKSVIALKASLDNYNVFYLGLQAYTAGVAEAASGAGTLSAGIGELKNGSGKLYGGSTQLYDGILTMKKSAPALTDGITQLRDGALELSDGLTQFNEEGIQKLVDAVDGDLDGLFNRLRKISEVSKNYKSFAGIDDSMDGKVKFIYRTEAVEKE